MKNIEEIRKSKDITLVDIADLLGVDYRTVRSKIDGVSVFKFGETVAIKKAFFPEYELEYLFSERSEA